MENIIKNYIDEKEKLNKKQREVFKNVLSGGNLLVIAVPGSGKTKTATISASGLIIEKKVNPTEIFFSTFTKKASTEMKERLEKIVTREVAENINIYTFHAFCYQMLKKFGGVLYPEISKFEMLDEDNQFFLFEKIFNETINQLVDTGVLQENLAIEFTKNKKNILSTINKNKNINVLLKEYSDNNKKDICTVEGLTVRVWASYEYAKKEKNILDFNDIMILMNSLLRDERFNLIIKKFTKYIFIDEFQDTNRLQMDIIDKINQGNLYVFGDDAQSIYKFRGSDISVINNFKVKYNANVINMDTNYRSHKIITDIATQLIHNNKTNIKKYITPFNKTPDDCITSIIEANNEYEEASLIADFIEKRKEKNLGDIAIIYRNNSIGEKIAYELKSRNIIYDRKEEYNIFNRTEIKLLFTFISAYAGVEESIKKIFLEQKGIGKKTVEKIEEEHKKQTDKTFLEIALENKSDKVKTVANMINNFINNKEINNIRNFFNYLLEDLNLKILGEEKIKNINYIFNLFNVFENIKDIKIDLLIKLKENSVKLITCHSSKGLEFDTVFIPSFNQEIIPSIQSLQDIDNDEIEEERRLAYVAITRAKKNLIFSYYNYSTERNKQMVKSQFLNEFETSAFGVKNVINNTKENESHVISNINNIIKKEFNF